MSHGEGDERDDNGFGLVEIIVSMFLLGLLAVTFLPLLVQALRVTAVNDNLVAASQLVATRFEQLRAVGTDCADLKALAASPVPVSDVDGHPLQTTVSAIQCPAAGAFPATVAVRVAVTDLAGSHVVVESSTLVFVDR
ncbi:MAG: type II secretion system protein [Burkholderiaceae bacterium]|nr:type II secretion system protein [Microbacteriaceae bacterium]